MNDFFQKYLSNQCSEDEFDSTINFMLSNKKRSVCEAKMKEHWEMVEHDDKNPNLTNTLYSIHYHINKKEKVKTLNLISYFSRIAAILIVPITLALIYFAQQDFKNDSIMQTVSAPLAARTNFYLPDGSKVWLNAGSSLRFPAGFSHSKRQVKLTGQAFFDVNHDDIPFVVETDNFKVDVLGTAFDVSAYKNEKASVTLVRGKVLVGTDNGFETVLKPGEQAVVTGWNGKIATQKVNAGALTAWKDNILVFDNEPMEEAIPRLERWYGVKIKLGDKAIKKISLTGTFQFEGIGEILHLLEITNSIKYTYNEEQRVLILTIK